MKKIICCIFSYEITRGMKSYGSISLLKSKKQAKELIFHVVNNTYNAVKYKDLYLVLGFEQDKVSKKVLEYNIKSNILLNNLYETSNTGYAFKLFISALIHQTDPNIDGVLFINGNTILKKIPKYPTDKSWVLVSKKNKNQENYIGCQINDNMVQYMYYDIGDYAWTDVFFLKYQDIVKIYNHQNLYSDHMFGFEIINTAIEKQNVIFNILCLDKHNDLIKINGLKDKNKIK